MYSTLNFLLSLAASSAAKDLLPSNQPFYGRFVLKGYPLIITTIGGFLCIHRNFPTLAFLVRTGDFPFRAKNSDSSIRNSPFFRSLFCCHKHRLSLQFTTSYTTLTEQYHLQRNLLKTTDYPKWGNLRQDNAVDCSKNAAELRKLLLRLTCELYYIILIGKFLIAPEVIFLIDLYFLVQILFDKMLFI